MEETKPWVWVCQFEEPGLHPPIGQCPADQSVAVRQRNLALWPSICQDSTDLHVGPSSGGGRYFGMGGGPEKRRTEAFAKTTYPIFPPRISATSF